MLIAKKAIKMNLEVEVSDNERRTEHIDIERWTIKELVLIAGMLTTIVSTAAIAQYQIAENRIDIKESKISIKELKSGLTAHLQWVMEHELAAKQKEIDRLRSSK